MPENGPVVVSGGRCAVVGFSVGVTEYGVGQLSGVVYVTPPETGKTYRNGEAFAILESVKAAQELILNGDGKATCMEAMSDSPVAVQHLVDAPEETPIAVFAGDFEVASPMTKEEYLVYVEGL